jgi:Fic family protein
MSDFQSVPHSYLDEYIRQQPYTLQKHLNRVKATDSPEQFGFYVASSAVYSSRLEGNRIDLDTYWKYRNSGINTSSKLYREIQDLIRAYEFARQNDLTQASALTAHSLLSATIFEEEPQHQGSIRKQNVNIYAGPTLVYEAADYTIVQSEVDKLFADVQVLLTRTLPIDEVFYYAALLHLRIAQIHPFADGNGRVARLVEKWFLSQQLGNKAWFIQSEFMYYKRQAAYYKNINLAPSYTTLEQRHCLPFLLMLPGALREKGVYKN